MIATVSPTFCVLPWVHAATLTDGSVVLCCVAKNVLDVNLNTTSLKQAWNSEAVREARIKMLKGEKVAACVHCYREEAGGYASHRVTENLAWQERFSESQFRQLIQSTGSDGHLDFNLMSVDLRLGNTCNLTCVMCRPQDSSKWVAQAKKLENTVRDRGLFDDYESKAKIDVSKFEWYRRPEFWEDLKEAFGSIVELIIGGGEPMLLEEHRRLIKFCVEQDHAQHIKLRYHTNGTVLDPKIFEYWKHFKEVEVFVSLDGIGDRNHYMRYPSQWPVIERNLHLLDKYPHGNIDVALLCSVHVMSAFYLDEYADWVEKQNFRIVNKKIEGYFHPGIVHHPSHLNVQTLPNKTKDLIRDKILAFEKRSRKPSPKIHGVIGFMYEINRQEQLPVTKEYFRALDVSRKTSFAKTMPELYQELYECSL